MKTFKKVLVFAFAGLISFSALAIGNSDVNADQMLRVRITQKLAAVNSAEQLGGIALVEFMIDENQKIVIISVQASDENIKNFIMASLDGKKIKVPDGCNQGQQTLKVSFKPER